MHSNSIVPFLHKYKNKTKQIQCLIGIIGRWVETDDVMIRMMIKGEYNYLHIWRGDLTLAVSMTTPNKYDWNCQWPVARWLPRGGVRWGKPHEISNFNCWGFPQPAQLPHLVTKRGNRVGARGDWCGIPWQLGGLWGFTLTIILLSSFQRCLASLHCSLQTDFY